MGVDIKIINKLLVQLNLFDSVFKAFDLEQILLQIKNQTHEETSDQPPFTYILKPQFYELVFRIAFDKYIRPNLIKSLPEALAKVLSSFTGVTSVFLTCKDWLNERFF